MSPEPKPRKPRPRRRSAEPHRCPRTECASPDAEVVGKVVHSLPGDPVEVVAIGFTLVCLRCGHTYVTTPAGVYSSIYQPRQVMDAIRQRQQQSPGRDATAPDFNLRPPNPGYAPRRREES